ncbi:hypothetical protein Ac2012v2_005575 [Leucoagaricus gongylophorus]
MQFLSNLFPFVVLSGIALSLPIRYNTREVPQEHSHEKFLTAVRTSLNLDNPDQILDPVFGLLGNAAAAQGAGKIADLDCLQQATADRAFTNAKQAGDINGQVAALIYRALERNTGKVGLVSTSCTGLQAVNPEIAAVQQHQDPASDNAPSINKQVVLELAKQIAALGGDPLQALQSGTFEPGAVNDPTAAGNTCDDANDPMGCIFTQNLLVPDATEAEIQAAVGGSDAGSSTNSGTNNAGNGNTTDAGSGNASVAGSSGSNGSNESESEGDNNNGATDNQDTSDSSLNLQLFTGALGDKTAPAVTAGGRGFIVEGSDQFLNIGAALGRSCDIQHNKCADFANSQAGRSTGLTVGQCDQQNTACHAAIQD